MWFKKKKVHYYVINTAGLQQYAGTAAYYDDEV